MTRKETSSTLLRAGEPPGSPSVWPSEYRGPALDSPFLRSDSRSCRLLGQVVASLLWEGAALWAKVSHLQLSQSGAPQGWEKC